MTLRTYNRERVEITLRMRTTEVGRWRVGRVSLRQAFEARSRVLPWERFVRFAAFEEATRRRVAWYRRGAFGRRERRRYYRIGQTVLARICVPVNAPARICFCKHLFLLKTLNTLYYSKRECFFTSTEFPTSPWTRVGGDHSRWSHGSSDKINGGFQEAIDEFQGQRGKIPRPVDSTRSNIIL